MASFTITGTTVTQQTLVDGENGYVATDGELVVTGADAVTASGSVEMAVYGNITSFGDYEALDFDGVDLELVVGAAGSIVSVSDDALDLSASFRMEVANLGAINADGYAISARTSDTGTSINIFNAGTLNGVGAIQAVSGSSTLLISNTGSMFSNGTTISVSSSTGPTRLVNSGTIESIGSYAVFLSSGNDRVTNTGTITGEVFLGNGDDRYDGEAGTLVGQVNGGNGNDTIIGGELGEALIGLSDDDVLSGNGGDDSLYGGTGNDTVRGGEGHDLIFGSDGFDDLRGNEGKDDMFGGAGKDELRGGDGDDLLDGGNADDILMGGAGHDVVIGGKGLDTIRGHDGDDTLRGGDQNDVLYGGKGDDVLEGGAAKDSLYGGKGDDTLTGGNGADVFVFERHIDNDVITDFEDGVDDIDLSAFGFATTGAAKAMASDVDGGVLFDFALAGGSGTLFVEGITKADINGSDLIL